MVHFEPVGERTLRVTFDDPSMLDYAIQLHDHPVLDDRARLAKLFDKLVGIPFIAMSHDSEAFYLTCKFG